MRSDPTAYLDHLERDSMVPNDDKCIRTPKGFNKIEIRIKKIWKVVGVIANAE